MKLSPALASLSLLACSQPANQPSTGETHQGQVEASPPISDNVATDRFDPNAINLAIAEFEKEPSVREVFFDPSNVVEWHIAVKDDGSKRYGLAGYFCLKLRETGSYDDDVDVRIIDADRVSQFKDAYRDYSLGGVQCKDEAQIW